MPKYNPTFTAEELQSEEWRPTPAWESVYEVSNLGRVKRVGANPNAKIGCVLSCQLSNTGYLRVHLRHSPFQSVVSVHVLVATAFLGPRPTPVHEVNHIDGVKTNNRMENLEYLTKAEHEAHTVRLRLKSFGDRHWTHLYPEKLSRGSQHWTRLHPERVARGDRNGMYTHPENRKRGSQNGSAKLNEEKVGAILQMLSDGISLGKIAKLFDVGKSTIHRISKGTHWRHVSN